MATNESRDFPTQAAASACDRAVTSVLDTVCMDAERIVRAVA
ncbi:hypothetical protein [Cryobacterium zhongshanensis]|nr:hypothetical protein [Cryobacterium zhongshanensis]